MRFLIFWYFWGVVEKILMLRNQDRNRKKFAISGWFKKCQKCIPKIWAKTNYRQVRKPTISILLKIANFISIFAEFCIAIPANFPEPCKTFPSIFMALWNSILANIAEVRNTLLAMFMELCKTISAMFTELCPTILATFTKLCQTILAMFT